jgi:hypothetical protein
MRAMGRWLGMVTAAIALGLGGSACGGGSPRAGALSSFGHMAGYVWSGPVTAVAGSWSVPGMSGAGEAHASSWIGAQAPGPMLRPPFIQVGTVEDRAFAHPVYRAFWTDTRYGFHPQILVTVRPGDVVSTALALSAGRWRVNIVDTTSGRRAGFSTREEGTADFNLAEWLQEDPSHTSGRPMRYPALSAVRMRGLAVNGATPRYGDLFAQWMSLPRGDLAPTPLRSGAFAITRGVLTPAGRRYLGLARPQNATARRVDVAEARWTTRTPAQVIEGVSATAAASERRYANALARAPWPAGARAAIGALVRAVRLDAATFAASARHAPASPAGWRDRFAELSPWLLASAHEVRRALHLPEIVSGQLPTSATRRAE